MAILSKRISSLRLYNITSHYISFLHLCSLLYLFFWHQLECVSYPFLMFIFFFLSRLLKKTDIAIWQLISSKNKTLAFIYITLNIFLLHTSSKWPPRLTKSASLYAFDPPNVHRNEINYKFRLNFKVVA